MSPTKKHVFGFGSLNSFSDQIKMLPIRHTGQSKSPLLSRCDLVARFLLAVLLFFFGVNQKVAVCEWCVCEEVRMSE
jgi:hypothetical protein